MTTTTTTTANSELAYRYARVIDANTREADDQAEGLPRTDPAAWKVRQAVTDATWAAFGDACHAAGLSVGEGIEAARVPSLGVHDEQRDDNGAPLR